jgi:ComEC/Rec2-related protein
LTAVRQGGIAHIFAVSGLHIGILFSAVYLLGKPLKKYRLLPAAVLAVCYSALCGFTVSSVRAVIMCICGGIMGVMGEKHDFLEGISLAAFLTLLVSPAQWLSVGFRLSFGACLGLALFAGSIARGLKFLPNFLAQYLSSSIAVQLFTFPVMLEVFGYVSVWGTLLNLVVIPLLPLLFLTLLVTALLSCMMPFAASVLLFPAYSMLSALLYAFSAVDLSFVIKGLTLGVGVTVWIAGCVALSQRFRLKTVARAVTAVVFALLFTATSLYENAVWTGCKLVTAEGMTLVESKNERVLILDSSVTLSKCEQFLLHRYTGTLNAVIVLGDEIKGMNTAAFLSTEAVWVREQTETGFQDVTVCFGEAFSVGELSFRYEGADRLSLSAESCVVEVSFEEGAAMSADLFVGDSGGLIFYLRHGIIKEL